MGQKNTGTPCRIDDLFPRPKKICAHDSGGNMTVEGCLVYSQLYLLIHDSGGMIGTFTVTYYILCYDSGWGDRDIWELHEQSSPFQRTGITT